MTDDADAHPTAPRSVSDEALRWIVRLHSGEATESDRSAFAEWRAADPMREAAAREAEELWGAASELRQEPGTGRASPGPVSGGGEEGGPSRRKLLGVAGLALAGAGAGWAAFGNRRAFADYATGVAQTRDVTLADGSRVALNARTALDVDFTPEFRRVVLLEGEALFDVAPDPFRPFRVVTRAAEVTALGTAFNIDADRPDGEVAVAVTQHAVRVRSIAGQAIDLRTAQGVTISGAGRIGDVAAVDPGKVLAWRSGTLVAENRPLGEVAAALRPYHSGWIMLRGDVGAIRVSAVLDLRRPIASLDTLAKALPISVAHLSPYLTVVSRR